jgi:hypothetical protein
MLIGRNVTSVLRNLRQKSHKFLIKFLPICHGWTGPCFKHGQRRRQGSAYHDDKLNWAFLCDDCQEQSHESWQQRWHEYWHEVI